MLDPAGVEAFVDGFMTAYLEENGAVGGVVSIVENGHIVLAKGYGEDDRARHREVEARRTLFRVGSVSKLFIWTAVMQLVERGKVDLDADVNRYLEGVEVPATFKEPVTLAHLMTHTAGFEDHVLGLFAHDATAVRPLRDLLADELPARVRAPGVVAAYSNHGAALAMLVVEQVSGMPWTEYVETQILGPLGMKRTTFRQPVPDALRDDVSIGYRKPDRRARGRRLRVHSAGAGGRDEQHRDRHGALHDRPSRPAVSSPTRASCRRPRRAACTARSTGTIPRSRAWRTASSKATATAAA